MKIAIALTLLLTTGLSLAQEAQAPEVAWREEHRLITTFVHRQKPVSIYELGRVTSRTTHVDAFAQELGEHMMHKTRELEVEVCATLCQSTSNQTWAAVITTAYARAACPVVDLCPKGYAPTEKDIHSHVDGTSYAPTETDRVFLSYQYDEKRKVKTYPFAFSEGDLKKPFGYLVHSRGVMYQEGKGRVRRVSWVD